jgi:hypothetical protein
VPESSPSSEPAVDAKVLDGYLGRYEMTPAFILT